MFKRLLAAGSLFLLMGHPAVAGPKALLKRRTLSKAAHFLGNHVTLDVWAGASSGLASGGTFYCRQHNPDVEGCTGHYGSAVITEVGRAGFTAGMIALSEYGRKQHFREWFLPVVGTAAFNTYWGVRQFRTHERPEVKLLPELRPKWAN